MVKSRAKRTKKPSKTLMSKINAFNRENEACNKKLNAKRTAIIKQAKKEGFAVSMYR